MGCSSSTLSDDELINIQAGEQQQNERHPIITDNIQSNSLDNIHEQQDEEEEEEGPSPTQPTEKKYCDVYKNDCPSLNRLIQLLIFYKSEYMNTKEVEVYFNENKAKIMSDYHHLLNEHLNEDIISSMTSNSQFKHVHTKLLHENKLQCDINKCKMYRRNQRDRNVSSEDNAEEITVGMDILDCIHCYFIHSVDDGIRFIDNIHEAKKAESDDESNEYFDREMQRLSSQLSQKMNRIIGVRGSNRLKQTKFVTEIFEDDTKIDDNDDDEENPNDYNFGIRYHYEPKAIENRYDFLRLTPNHKNLKQEMTQNTIYPLSMDEFNKSHTKALGLMNDSDHVKSIKSDFFDGSIHYGITKGSPLTFDHILSVVFYCDYDSLSYHFSSTFRLIPSDKHDKKNAMKRNLEYGNWTRYLQQTVNCFGTKLSESAIKVYYHGVSFLYLNKFIETFNAPTSTTTKLSVAYQFAQPNDGIVLELTKPHETNHCYLRYFNCSFFSYFANEDERLFITPHNIGLFLKFVNIRNISENEKYDTFVKSLTLLQTVVDSGHYLSKGDSAIVPSLNLLIREHIKSSSLVPEYILISFKKWVDTIESVSIPMEKSKWHDLFLLAVFNDKKQANVFVLNQVFDNLKVYLDRQFSCRRL